MRGNEEKIYGMISAPISAILDSPALLGTNRHKIFTASAAMLSLLMPSNTNASSINSPENQVVLMRCVARSMPDEIIKKEIRVQLEQMKSLQPNWIEGANPISQRAISYVEELLEHSYDLDWYGWEVSPYINGTILINYREKDILASINITDKGASAFVQSPTKYFAVEETDFDVKDIYDYLLKLSPLNLNRINA